MPHPAPDTMNECKFCSAPIPDEKVGGHVQEFCDQACRNGFHKAARILGAQVFASGVLVGQTPRQWLEASKRSYMAGERQAAE